MLPSFAFFPNEWNCSVYFMTQYDLSFDERASLISICHHLRMPVQIARCIGRSILVAMVTMYNISKDFQIPDLPQELWQKYVLYGCSEGESQCLLTLNHTVVTNAIFSLK